MNRKTSLAVALALGIAAGGASTASAAAGRIPIADAAVISESGSYFLSEDITDANSGTGYAIQIAASHVTLDLDGHTIFVDTTGNLGIVGLFVTDVRIRNGQIVARGGGVDGINLSSPGGEFAVEDVTIIGFTGSGLRISGQCVPTADKARAVISGVTVKAGPSQISGDSGMDLSCLEASRIERSQMRDSFFGINLDRVDDSVVRDNVTTENANYGIRMVKSRSNIVKDNIATANGRLAPVIPGTGILLEDSANNELSHNNASNNTGNGIVINGVSGVAPEADYNRLTYNTSSFNGNNGIVLDGVSSFNSLDFNQAAGNQNGYGIDFRATASNIFSNNRAPGNSAGGYNNFVVDPGPPPIYNNVDVEVCGVSTNY